MTHMVNCVKLGTESEGLEFPPIPGELGQRIYDNISKQAWQAWLGRQTMLINEYRLNMLDPEAAKFLRQEMENFLFGGGSDLPPGYTNPEE